MASDSFGVLIVEDYEPWLRLVLSKLKENSKVRVVGDVSDGLAAVQRAHELQPDLILLDIGLPGLNGFEVARRIRRVSPNSRLLFLSDYRSAETVEVAMGTGANGYVVKSDAGRDLVRAVETVLQGKQFVSASVAFPEKAGSGHCHEVEFYPDDAAFMDGYARFLSDALKIGNPAIVIASEIHRAGILERLDVEGLSLGSAIEERRYVELDAAATLSTVMVNGMLSPALCANAIGDLIARATKAGKRGDPRVAICGECAPTLLAAGKAEATIELEHLWDEITKGQPAYTLCGYQWSLFPSGQEDPIFQRICAEHSGLRGCES
jgi:CheY-like chemotaxis protein